MSEIVHDPLPQELISPNSVATYLAASGWELVLSDPSKMVWHLQEGRSRRVSVMLPLDRTYVDYSDRFDEALNKLCQVHNWGIEQLVSDILQSRSDLLLIRADQATLNDSIPILQAKQLLSGSVDMLIAAARATVSPRASFRGNYPESTRDFLNQDVRMGHTRRGSFILTVLTSLTDHDNTTTSARTGAQQIEAGHASAESPSRIPDSIDPGANSADGGSTQAHPTNEQSDTTPSSASSLADEVAREAGYPSVSTSRHDNPSHRFGSCAGYKHARTYDRY